MEENDDFIYYYYICDKRENLKMNEKRDRQRVCVCEREGERERNLILPNRLSQFISKELREIQQNIDTLNNIVTHAKA